MKVIVFTLGDGRTALTPASPIIVNRLMEGGLSETDAIEAIGDHAVLRQQQIGAGPITNRKTLDDVDIPEVDYVTGVHGEFRDALDNIAPGPPVVNISKAREIHAERIAIAQAAEIARLQVEEHKEQLKGDTARANDHAVTVSALEALDLNVLATQIAAAPNPTALSTVWPANVPR